MAKQLVFVEINPTTELPIRIIKSRVALQLSPERVRQMARSVAVGSIRKQVVDRARRGRLIKCEFCGKIITEQTGHMHEVTPRGKGGEISLDNSRYICKECHIDGEHGDRRFQSGKNESKTKRIRPTKNKHRDRVGGIYPAS